MSAHSIRSSGQVTVGLVLAAVVLSWVCATHAALPIPTPISFGETICDEISLPGEVDYYTLHASAGDIILVRMVANANVFMDPKLEVYDPNGMMITSASGAFLAEISSLELPVSGIYTVLSMDNAGTHTGAYCIHVQRLNDPGQAMPIGFGEVLCETTWPLSETDAYTFQASAGDLMLIRMVATANVFMNPLFRIYDPDGHYVTGASGAYLAEIGSLELAADGQYTILAMDAAGDHGGDYCIHIQRLNAPGNTTPIDFYDTLCDTITMLAQTDAYVFAGALGDMIRINMSASANVFMDPEIRLYDPSGTLVASATHAYLAVINDLELQEDGIFTILAMDVGGDDGGDYSVSLICLSPPCGPPECPADFDGDGDVDTADLLFLLAQWGTPGGDVDADGDTDTADLLALLGAWGECYE